MIFRRPVFNYPAFNYPAFSYPAFNYPAFSYPLFLSFVFGFVLTFQVHSSVHAQEETGGGILGVPVSQSESDLDDTDHDRLFDGCGGETVAATNFEFEQQVAYLTNQERASAGLPPMKLNSELSDAARYHSADMSQDDYFEHDSYDREGNTLTFVCSTWDRIQAYYPSPRAENIAWNYRSAEAVVEAWINSPGHYSNIVGNYREIGVGLYDWYWNQDFGSRNDVYPVVINGEAIRTPDAQVTLYTYGSWQEIRIRNDNGPWSAWMPFQNQMPWTIDAIPGLRTVSVEMRSGGDASAASDTIEYNGAASPPTAVPTAIPTTMPTTVPTTMPTLIPTEMPTEMPTEIPPTQEPTAAPTEMPVDPTASPVAPMPTSEMPIAPTAIGKPTITPPPTNTPPPTMTSTPDQVPPRPTDLPTAVPTNTPPPSPTTEPTTEPTVAVIATATPFPTQPPPDTTTTLPGRVTLRGNVELEGRPPAPDPRWESGITVSLHDPFTGDLLESHSTKTDAYGNFEIYNIVPTNYQIGVKGAHTLQTGTRVDLRNGDAEVSFGVLLEGDANDDNVVNIWDYSLWSRSRDNCAGWRSYNENTDFNQSGCTDREDVQMLFANFGLQGSLNGGVTERASDGRDAEIRPVAAIQNKQAGERFTVTLDLLDRENNLVQMVADGGSIHLRYSPDWLRAISVSGPASLGTIVEYTVDNQLGHIDFAAVAEDEPALIDGTLATITFEANREIGVDANGVPAQITVEMVHTGPNSSDLTLSGTSLLADGAGGQSTRIIGDGLLAYLESEAGKNPTPTLAESLFLPLTMP